MRVRKSPGRSAVLMLLLLAITAIGTVGCESIDFDSKDETRKRPLNHVNTGETMYGRSTALTMPTSPEFLAITDTSSDSAVHLASADALSTKDDPLVEKMDDFKEDKDKHVVDPLTGSYRSGLAFQADAMLRNAHSVANEDSQNSASSDSSTPTAAGELGGVPKDVIKHFEDRKRAFGSATNQMDLNIAESARVARVLAEQQRQRKIRAERGGIDDPFAPSADSTDSGGDAIIRSQNTDPTQP